jgi:hypothetical protein
VTFLAERWHCPQQSGMLGSESPIDQLTMEFAVALTRILCPMTLLAVLSLIAPWTARADAPSACKFLTPSLVSAALGKPQAEQCGRPSCCRHHQQIGIHHGSQHNAIRCGTRCEHSFCVGRIPELADVVVMGYVSGMRVRHSPGVVD